ncbi:c-type cytochrome [Methyloterricola oryzae]|uniref:c-type cytochrome n=1 Tax=Methyloterricola oryzae TaxID=1495050 RepID=UPI0005EB3614|nr:hypothetical protein [Methyloterricola oryzae]
MTRTILFLLCLCSQALAAPAPGARPAAAMLARACSGCHAAVDERAGPAVRSFSGMRRDQFLGAMRGFKSGERQSSIMNRIAKGYQDADFQALGTYYELP